MVILLTHWMALFKLKSYSKSKQILQEAVRLMPSDPIINDHFGDALWMNGLKYKLDIIGTMF